VSRHLGYFPPNGTRWQWTNKSLQTSPWTCALSRQWAGDNWVKWSPMSVDLSVDLIKDEYVWGVRICDWSHRHRGISGKAPVALEACLAAEDAGQRALSEMTPEWVRRAVAEGWRPPLRSNQ
jgi:hypothetical protein